MPVADACAYVLGGLDAFTYLHERGLVYCDFKPDNLLHVGDDVKLIDLGGWLSGENAIPGEAAEAPEGDSPLQRDGGDSPLQRRGRNH